MAIYESYVDSVMEETQGYLPIDWSFDQRQWFDAANYAEEMSTAFAGQPLGSWWESQVELCWARIHKNVPYTEKYVEGIWGQ